MWNITEAEAATVSPRLRLTELGALTSAVVTINKRGAARSSSCELLLCVAGILPCEMAAGRNEDARIHPFIYSFHNAWLMPTTTTTEIGSCHANKSGFAYDE